YSLVGIAEDLLALDRAGEAIEFLERARTIREAVGDPGELGEAECLLGRALVEGAGSEAEESRGRELGQAGVAHLDEAGDNWTAQARDCRAWMAR
ncbi:MAG: hypothetical protein KC457_33860, partial [Myxococcales bacterium]|nr:hypothetical protein [Myxococcales bacterium]